MGIKTEIKQEAILKAIAKAHNVDYRICKAIVDSPFLYLKYLITDPSLEHGIRIPYFGAFCQKGDYKNKTMRTETRVRILLDNIVDVAAMMAATQGFIVPTTDSAKEIIENAWSIGDYEKINFIWEGWKDFNKQ